MSERKLQNEQPPSNYQNCGAYKTYKALGLADTPQNGACIGKKEFDPETHTSQIADMCRDCPVRPSSLRQS